jgi:hypothetical protein
MLTLITGNGKAGSYKIRAEQLGAAIGAEICPNAGKRDIADADLVIVVKRTPDSVITHLRDLGKPWVWDVVDAWPQPAGNDWVRSDAITWLRGTLDYLKPNGVVFPTQTMLHEAQFAGRVLCLPHHARPGLAAGEPRERVSAVVYEGAENYLGRWRGIVEKACAARGWRFLINPADIREGDIGLALRDVTGWPGSAWKSNVKLANIQAAGLPFVGSRERGYMETGNGTESYVDTEADLCAAFDRLSSYAVRRMIHAEQVKCAPRLETLSTNYAAWLEGFSSFAVRRSQNVRESA